MKIALITIHHANSYGGMLQAYATQKILSRYGEVEIIDYKTIHLRKTMQVVKFGYSFRDFLRTAKDILRLFPRYRLIKSFKDFQNKYFMQTREIISFDHLKALEKDFDVFICGSDQIWNPKILEGFDAAYFLNFIENKKKISYASSAGSYFYNDSEKVQLKSYLEGFSYISVREDDLNFQCATILERDDIQTVLDPTLLLSKKEWLDAFKIKINNTTTNYILIYTLTKDAFTKEIINKITEILNMKVVAIDQDPFLGYKANEHKNDIGPIEYLELFANASFVITNSFHGTAFSINFNIPFIAIKPQSGVNRIEDLLSKLGLHDRLISKSGDIQKENLLNLSFDHANHELAVLRNNSIKFIESALA